jgi:hypothetical protein
MSWEGIKGAYMKPGVYMKYDRMICWVRPHEKQDLIAEIKERFPVLFVDNVKSLKELIKTNDYVVISCGFAEYFLEEIQDVARTTNNTIALYDRTQDEDFTVNAGDLFREPNVITGLWWSEDIVKNFLGEIPDLTRYVLENFHLEFGLEDGSPGARLVHN